VLPDYYAVLQVHPDADFEVIEAAYRQLMKKHHPDMAGEDPQRIATHEARAKAINEAFRILRDPNQRRRYDYARIYTGTVPTPTATATQATSSAAPTASGRPASPPPAPPQPEPTTPSPAETYAAVQQPSWLLAPFTLINSAYYLLPGPYEWEPGGSRDLLTVLLIPVLGILAFALATGRLAPLIGHSLPATILAWTLIVITALLSMWTSLPRVAMAVLPSIAVLTGWLTPTLQQAHVPIWIAWGLLSSLSLIFAARLYVFGVLPTLGVIWLLSRAS
jgi:hypothetical protein